MDYQFSDMVAESHFFDHEEDERNAKIASTSTRSPTTIFAIDDLSSVFRMPDDAIERESVIGHQEKDASSNSRRRCLTLLPSQPMESCPYFLKTPKRALKKHPTTGMIINLPPPGADQ